jgi:hypothetical protein
MQRSIPVGLEATTRCTVAYACVGFDVVEESEDLGDLQLREERDVTTRGADLACNLCAESRRNVRATVGDHWH